MSGEGRVTGRTSITYVLPGGFKATYSGNSKSYWRWLSDTATGGCALGRMWITCALFLLQRGDFPMPSRVTALMLDVWQEIMRRARCAEPSS